MHIYTFFPAKMGTPCIAGFKANKKERKRIFACKVALLLICMYVASRIAILNDGLLVVSRIYEKRH